MYKNKWNFFSSICSYTKNIFALFIQNSAKWHILWCYFLRLMDIDIPRSASTLNAFLTIVEPALRSSVPTRRAEGYLCWRVCTSHTYSFLINSNKCHHFRYYWKFWLDIIDWTHQNGLNWYAHR